MYEEDTVMHKDVPFISEHGLPMYAFSLWNRRGGLREGLGRNCKSCTIMPIGLRVNCQYHVQWVDHGIEIVNIRD